VVFNVKARRQTLPAVLNLLRQIVREPSFPEKELDLLKQETLSGMEQGLTDPQALAQRKVARALSPYPQDDPRYVPEIEEEMALLKGVTRDQVEALYQKFLGGENGELSIVGDFDPAEIIPSVESLLDGWKSSEKYSRIPRPATKLDGGNERILTPDKKNAVYLAAMPLTMKDSDPEYPALAIGNYLLGGGALSSRLGDRIRQKEGLSYTIQSQLQASSLDENTLFRVYAISNPENSDKVQKAVAEEIEKLMKDGLLPGELEKARQGWLQQQQIMRSNDAMLARMLGSNLVSGRTMDFYAKQDAAIAKLTADDILKALRKRIDPKKMFITTAGDFEKKK
jgi:zinc protease